METAAIIAAICTGIATLAGVLITNGRTQADLRQIKSGQASAVVEASRAKESARVAEHALTKNGGGSLHDAIHRIEAKLDANHADAQAEYARLWAAIDRRPWWRRTERNTR